MFLSMLLYDDLLYDNDDNDDDDDNDDNDDNDDDEEMYL